MKQHRIHHHLILIALLCFSASINLFSSEINPFVENTRATEKIGKQYINAYMALDWDKLETLAHKELSFNDPTAANVWVAGSQMHEGKVAAMQNFRTAYASIVEMNFDLIREFFSDQYAIFEGSLNWTWKDDAGGLHPNNGMPIVVILKIEEGKVIEHRDYADYRQLVDMGE